MNARAHKLPAIVPTIATHDPGRGFVDDETAVLAGACEAGGGDCGCEEGGEDNEEGGEMHRE